jgi:hypothetical protein
VVHGIVIPREIVTGYPIFFHQENVTVHQNVTYLGQRAMPNGTGMSFYNASYAIPGDLGAFAWETGPMKSRPPDYITITVDRYNHPGISVSAQPANQTLGFNSSLTVKVTFTVSSDAPLGTYWLELPPGPCEGGPEYLFTVGDRPYSGKVDRAELAIP